MNKNDKYTSSNSLDYDHLPNHFKLISIDLSKQIELENPDLKQKLISLIKLKKIMEQQCFSSLKSQKKQLLIFHKFVK